MMGFLNNKNLCKTAYDKPSQQGLQRLQVTGSIVSKLQIIHQPTLMPDFAGGYCEA